MVSSTTRLLGARIHHVSGDRLCTGCIGSYKSNYHTITPVIRREAEYDNVNVLFLNEIGLNIRWLTMETSGVMTKMANNGDQRCHDEDG